MKGEIRTQNSIMKRTLNYIGNDTECNVIKRDTRCYMDSNKFITHGIHIGEQTSQVARILIPINVQKCKPLIHIVYMTKLS